MISALPEKQKIKYESFTTKCYSETDYVKNINYINGKMNFLM